MPETPTMSRASYQESNPLSYSLNWSRHDCPPPKYRLGSRFRSDERCHFAVIFQPRPNEHEKSREVAMPVDNRTRVALSSSHYLSKQEARVRLSLFFAPVRELDERQLSGTVLGMLLLITVESRSSLECSFVSTEGSDEVHHTNFKQNWYNCFLCFRNIDTEEWEVLVGSTSPPTSL